MASSERTRKYAVCLPLALTAFAAGCGPSLPLNKSVSGSLPSDRIEAYILSAKGLRDNAQVDKVDHALDLVAKVINDEQFRKDVVAGPGTQAELAQRPAGDPYLAETSIQDGATYLLNLTFSGSALAAPFTNQLVLDRLLAAKEPAPAQPGALTGSRDGVVEFAIRRNHRW